jgi:hypothetical protein
MKNNPTVYSAHELAIAAYSEALREKYGDKAEDHYLDMHPYQSTLERLSMAVKLLGSVLRDHPDPRGIVVNQPAIRNGKVLGYPESNIS